MRHYFFSIAASIFIFIASQFVNEPAHAYVGLGAALGLVGYSLTLGSMIGLSVLSILAWPAFVIYKKYKSKKVGDVSTETKDSEKASAD